MSNNDHPSQTNRKLSSHHRFNLIDELGGETRFRAILTDFYDRIYSDMIIGFMFQPFDKKHLIESQMQWAASKLGDRSGSYHGPSVFEAHKHLPIHPGMFDRRHKILDDVLHDWNAPQYVIDAWLELDTALRDNVIKWGRSAREAHGEVFDDNV